MSSEHQEARVSQSFRDAVLEVTERGLDLEEESPVPGESSDDFATLLAGFTEATVLHHRKGWTFNEEDPLEGLPKELVVILEAYQEEAENTAEGLRSLMKVLKLVNLRSSSKEVQNEAGV